MLYLMNMEMPPEMTGTPLVELLADNPDTASAKATAEISS
jgi:hypothetical protein